MEITKEILQQRMASLNEQLGLILGRASEHQGAIMALEDLLVHLETEAVKYKVSRAAEVLMANSEIEILAVAAHAGVEPGGAINIANVRAFINDGDG